MSVRIRAVGAPLSAGDFSGYSITVPLVPLLGFLLHASGVNLSPRRLSSPASKRLFAIPDQLDPNRDAVLNRP